MARSARVASSGRPAVERAIKEFYLILAGRLALSTRPMAFSGEQKRASIKLKLLNK